MSPPRDVRGLLRMAVRLLNEVIELLAPHHHPHHVGHTTIHVVAVGPYQEKPMPTVDHAPDFRLSSANNFAILAVVGALLPNGDYVGTDVDSWTTNNTSNPLVELPDGIVTEADPNWVDPGDGSTAPQVPKLDAQGRQIPVFYIQVNTPGDDGNDTITWSAPGMASCDIHVIWATPPVGHVMISPSEKPEA